MSMADIEVITLPHLEQYRLFAALYSDVSNVNFLRQQLFAGNKDFEYALLDAAMIASREHLLAACFRAVNDMRQDRLRSRNVHSEIVFALSPNNNISESFRRFGLSEKTRHLIVVKVATVESPAVNTTVPSYESVAVHVGEHVQGTQCTFDDASIAKLRDNAALRKVYKTVDVASIMGSMAIKGL